MNVIIIFYFIKENVQLNIYLGVKFHVLVCLQMTQNLLLIAKWAGRGKGEEEGRERM